MRRRDFVHLVAGAAIMAPVAARSQQKTMRVVGCLYGGSPGPNFTPGPSSANESQPFHLGLRETGFFDGKNVAYEYRFAEDHYDRLPVLATDLVNRKVDVIITISIPCALALKHATSTIPIVFFLGGDPVENGLVASLARPGGNLTGFVNLSVALIAKQLDLLSELVPRVTTIALLVNPANSTTEHVVRSARDAARVRGMNLSVQKASTEDEIEVAFTSLVQEQVGGLIVADEPLFADRQGKVLALVSRHAIPTICGQTGFAAAGGLISYAADFNDMQRNVGIYAGRILKGARPADMPVQQATVFKLAVNLKTAKSLGLTVPQSILVRADEVIE